MGMSRESGESKTVPGGSVRESNVQKDSDQRKEFKNIFEVYIGIFLLF